MATSDIATSDTSIVTSDTTVVKTGNSTFGNITVTLTKNEPPGFSPTVREIREAAEYELRGKESGMINENSGASAVIRQNGQINLSSTKYASYKLNPTGKSIEYTLESVAVTNRRKILCNDFIINEHKMNPKLYDLTDFKELELPTNESVIVGNFCVYGSVLTKSWDADLKRYMLIRRPVRMPMFSPLLNVPDIHQGLGIEDPLKIDPDILGITEAGYHVNMVISDAGSLIGKEGVDRPGIDRTADQSVEGMVTNSGTGSTAGTGTTGTGATGTSTSNNGDLDTEVVSTPVPSDIVKADMVNKIAEARGIRPRLLWAAMAFESSKFSNQAAQKSHNYSLLVRCHETRDKYKHSEVKHPLYDKRKLVYIHFDSDDEFIQYCSDRTQLAYGGTLSSSKTIREAMRSLYGEEITNKLFTKDEALENMLRYLKEIPNSFVGVVSDGNVDTSSIPSDYGEGKYWIRQHSGVSTSGAQPQTMAALYLLGKWFYEKTGKLLIATAITNGDHPSNGSPHGHDAGWKVDINDWYPADYSKSAAGTITTDGGGKGTLVDEMTQYGHSIGLGMNWESDHIDVAADGNQWEGTPHNYGGLKIK